MKTGVQMSSLKPLMTSEAQTRAAFERVAAMGGGIVQLQWIDRAVPISFIARAAEETGIRSVSVQDFYETVSQDKNYYIELNQATGGTWMCVSRIPERLKSDDGLSAYVEELRAFERQLAPLGQKLCFHPVSGDYQPFDGVENPVRELLRRMPELSLCLDLYHVNRCGFSMAEWILAYAGRVCMTHFKDARGDKLTPAGQGDTNWAGVVDACLQADVPYAFVEQETWDRDPFDCLKEALDWLNAQL